MIYELALQTPTVLLNVPVMDAANKVAQLQVEFKRYEAKEAYAFLKEHDAIATEVQATFEGIKFSKEIADFEKNPETNADKIEELKTQLAKLIEEHKHLQSELDQIDSFWESPTLIEAVKFKDFVRKHLVDFKNLAGLDETGKRVKVASALAIGDVDKAFDAFWKSIPYREALKDACVQALQNKANK